MSEGLITRRQVIGTVSGLMLVPVGMGAGQQREWLFELSYTRGAVPLEDGIAFVGRGVRGAGGNTWGVGLIDFRLQRLRWWVETDASPHADMIVHDDAIYAASVSQALKIDVVTGRIEWEYDHPGQLNDFVRVGPELVIVGSEESEATVARINTRDGVVSEHRFQEFGPIKHAASRGINSVAVASNRYVGIFDTIDNSISWGVEYEGRLEWVLPIAPNLLAMVANTGFASRLIFAGEDGFVEEVDTDDPRIQGVVHTENQLLYAYGFRSMACVDWTTREIIWERQFETAIQSVTLGGRPRGAIVATSDGNVTLMGYSGSEIAVYDIGESADLGVYWTTSYFAWGSHADGFILETSDLAPVDRPALEPFSTASVPNLISTSIRGMVAGMIVMIGLLSVQGMFRLGLADERPMGRVAVGERRFAALLALVGGTFGAHKFYQGRDVAYLSVLFFWTGLPTLLGVYESIKYLRFTDQEYQNHLESLAERNQSSEGDD